MMPLLLRNLFLPYTSSERTVLLQVQANLAFRPSSYLLSWERLQLKHKYQVLLYLQQEQEPHSNYFSLQVVVKMMF